MLAVVASYSRADKTETDSNPFFETQTHKCEEITNDHVQIQVIKLMLPKYPIYQALDAHKL